jgi:integrase
MSSSTRAWGSSTPSPMKIGSEVPIVSGYSVRSMINQFLSGKALNTQKNYGRALLVWAGYLTAWGAESQELTWEHLLKADVHQAKGLLAHLSRQGLSLNTQRTYVSGLASFYEELEQTGFTPAHGNIFRSPLLKAPRKGRQPKNPSAAFTEEQVEAIITSATNPRDKLILSLLFGVGLRKAELLNLNAEDVTEVDGVPCIILRDTKAHAFRPHSIAPWIHELALAYVQGKHGKLFPISRTSVDTIFSKYVARAGIPGKWSPHDARCSVINIMINKGVPLQAIQEFSRHSSLKMLEEYRRRSDTLSNNPGRSITFGKIGK